MIVALEAHRAKQYHLGLGRNTIVKATLAYANQTRDYRIFEDFAFYMMTEACKKRETNIFDRAYDTFKELYKIHLTGSYYVVRAKTNLKYKTVKWKRRML